jgi:bifunctional DNase/RNase
MVEMYVESVRVSTSGLQRVVVLKEKNSDRYLLIWVGTPEAGAIALSMQGIPVARPMTHDLLKNVIEAMGAKVRRILVTDLVDNTFYARIILDVDGKSVEVDSRPSDAIALALRVQSSIFVEEKVLDEAGITAGSESDKSDDQDLTVFRDFINSLSDDASSPDPGGKRPNNPLS